VCTGPIATFWEKEDRDKIYANDDIFIYYYDYFFFSLKTKKSFISRLGETEIGAAKRTGGGQGR
jgi:hypothetical protein